jgi:hypothetical protein
LGNSYARIAISSLCGHLDIGFFPVGLVDCDFDQLEGAVFYGSIKMALPETVILIGLWSLPSARRCAGYQEDHRIIGWWRLH